MVNIDFNSNKVTFSDDILKNLNYLVKKEKVIYECYEKYDLAKRIDEIINGNYIYNGQDIRKSPLFSIFLKSEKFKSNLLNWDISEATKEYLVNLYGEEYLETIVSMKR